MAVQVSIESLDKIVVDADPAQPGQFIARISGATQLHADLSRQGGLRQGIGIRATFPERQIRRKTALITSIST